MTGDRRLPGDTNDGVFHRPVLLAAIFAILTSVVLVDLVPRLAPGLLRFEYAMADVRTSMLSDQLPSQHPHVAIVGITDQTLSDYKTRLPIDRALLSRLVEAVDAAGAKAIGIDLLFYRAVPADNDEMFISALKAAKAKVVLAAADERLGLSQPQIDKQLEFFAQTGRPAGYANLATERDWVVRFKALPAPGSRYTKSFARMLVEAGGYVPGDESRRIAWLRDPRDGSDAFLNIPADALLGPADDPGVKAARAGLGDKIVIIGGLLPDLDQHLTPLTSQTLQRMAGAIIHAHIAAELIDGRKIYQLEVNSLVLRLGLAGLAAFGFLIGWVYRLKRQGILLSSLATVVIISIDTIAFWQSRIILPIVLALMAWFMGEFTGHWLGKWLGHRPDRTRWFVK
jgi:CHASE2 domain-containing sensor protein